ncbi:MAG: hypothetical protein Q7V58_12265 [Actinomycetota bacterium]|nr:hypothetical protein [Actinomycetota bacterium]
MRIRQTAEVEISTSWYRFKYMEIFVGPKWSIWRASCGSLAGADGRYTCRPGSTASLHPMLATSVPLTRRVHLDLMRTPATTCR